jgi:hypothetical protein
MASLDSKRLRELEAILRERQAQRRRLRSEWKCQDVALGVECDELRAGIADERERLQQERAAIVNANELKIVMQIESLRTYAQIAASFGLTTAEVRQVHQAWQQREGVTIRGGPLRDGRTVKQPV